MARFRIAMLLAVVFLFTSVGSGCVVLPGSSSHSSRCGPGKARVKHKGKWKCKKAKHRKHKKPKKRKKHKKHKKHKRH